MPTILIVDDHAGFRGEARRLLEAEGFTVVGEAVDGQSAIGLIESRRPDVILLDIGLPDIDGFEVADRLASAHPKVRVVLTSSRDGAVYEDRLNEAAAAGFLRKDELSGEAIRTILSPA